MTAHEKAVKVLAARDRRRIAAGGLANQRTTAVKIEREPLPKQVSALIVVAKVTTPARTVVDLLRTWPGHDRDLDRLVDDAFARGLTTVTELVECFERVMPAHAPGRTATLTHLTKRGGGFLAPDSELERIGRAAFQLWNCPTPVLGHRIPGRDSLVGRVDFAFPAERVVVELDGRRWHLSEHGFQSDRERDRAALLAGWRPFRFTWVDLTTRKAITRNEVSRIFAIDGATSAAQRR